MTSSNERQNRADHLAYNVAKNASLNLPNIPFDELFKAIADETNKEERDRLLLIAKRAGLDILKANGEKPKESVAEGIGIGLLSKIFNASSLGFFAKAKLISFLWVSMILLTLVLLISFILIPVGLNRLGAFVDDRAPKMRSDAPEMYCAYVNWIYDKKSFGICDGTPWEARTAPQKDMQGN